MCFQNLFHPVFQLNPTKITGFEESLDYLTQLTAGKFNNVQQMLMIHLKLDIMHH